ncbi:MAG TPA: hypothetical protein VEI27_02575 [Dehalococcoidales bacterium]|nr:hypothetical protein [Dehalococcoidales bacterium]
MIPESRVLVVLERMISGFAGVGTVVLAVVVLVVVLEVVAVLETGVVVDTEVVVVGRVVWVVDAEEQPTSKLTLTASAVTRERMGKSFLLNIFFLLKTLFSALFFDQGKMNK